MRAILSSTNPVRLSFVIALLADAGIDAIVLDTHASIVDGSIGAIPRRIMVDDDAHAQAMEILRQAGEL